MRINTHTCSKDKNSSKQDEWVVGNTFTITSMDTRSKIMPSVARAEEE